jgi:hypothetical protein
MSSLVVEKAVAGKIREHSRHVRSGRGEVVEWRGEVVEWRGEVVE